MEKENLVIYHGKCSDGFGAAYSAWKQLGDSADYVPMTYDDIEDLPNIKNRNVYILDFSFDRDVYDNILKNAKSVNLLDHHKTAYNKLCGCKGCFFDLNRSGAMIAWQYFNPKLEIPTFIRYIQDGDLWKFKYPETKPFYSAITSYPHNFKDWEKLEDDKYLTSFIEKGELLLENFNAQVLELSKNAKEIELLGYKGLMCNAPSEFTSQLGNVLAKKCNSFALIWQERSNNVKCGLRSVDSFDCSVIAEHFGGGGHPQACAFNLNNLSELVEIVKYNKKHKINP